MPSPSSNDDNENSDGSNGPNGPDTRADFDRALDELCRTAHLNGVEVGYGVDLRHHDGVPDWEVEITALEKPREG